MGMAYRTSARAMTAPRALRRRRRPGTSLRAARHPYRGHPSVAAARRTRCARERGGWVDGFARMWRVFGDGLAAAAAPAGTPGRRGARGRGPPLGPLTSVNTRTRPRGARRATGAPCRRTSVKRPQLLLAVAATYLARDAVGEALVVGGVGPEGLLDLHLDSLDTRERHQPPGSLVHLHTVHVQGRRDSQ